MVDFSEKRCFLFCFVHEHSSFSNLSVTSHTSQLILQPFRRFTYVTAHSPTLLMLHLCHSSFSNPYFASPTSQDLHLRHLANRPCFLDGVNDHEVTTRRLLFTLSELRLLSMVNSVTPRLKSSLIGCIRSHLNEPVNILRLPVCIHCD